MDRFTEEASARGLTPPDWLPPAPDDSPLIDAGRGLSTPAFAAEDFDGDGDIDIIPFDSLAYFYENDGAGYFTPRSMVLGEGLHGGPVRGALADLDGDELPDFILSRGGADESEASLVVLFHVDPQHLGLPVETDVGLFGPGVSACCLSLGDIDGDGWLDVHYVRGDVPLDPLQGLAPEVVLLGGPDGFSPERALRLEAAEGAGGIASQVSVMTDQDGDGALDLWVIGGTLNPEEGRQGTAFFRNEGFDELGSPVLVNRASEMGIEAHFPGMGIDSADLNGDGALDYCVTDVGPMRCFFSDGEGGLVEVGGDSLGLRPADLSLPVPVTIGWAIDFADLDNDGLLDVLQASAPDRSGSALPGQEFQDLTWRQVEEGVFEDVSAETQIGSAAAHFGLVSADFDGDGFIDVLVQGEGPDSLPTLHMNHCGSGHWVELEFRGADNNTSGIGAQVRFRWGSRSELRELYGPRALNQTPTRLHQGLGSSEVVDIDVRWPDGSHTLGTDLPVNRVLTAVHAEAELRSLGR
jgi:hypothetical protein